ncbi:Protein RETICULATA, chloroplastic [Vitis vinifera]|uniref:Protein RETICULATA, chloroplastic n=1 Tax=Vitis vinifera TaxID=29760 RepID=A0A438EA18_VITVI|nr:Protein RETICULATA, chloroplastic [Vitis vinifera]
MSNPFNSPKFKQIHEQVSTPNSIIGVAFAFGSYFFCSLMELDMLAAYHLHVIDLFLHPTAFCLSVFLAVSSNTRYQIINGLERVVEASPLAKKVPPVAMAFTVGVRFANNIYGGMQFVDWARWSGVQ